MPSRSRGAALLRSLALACALLLLLPPAAQADPQNVIPTITASASIGSDFVVVVTGGVVVAGGQSNNLPVRATVAGRDVGATATDGNGAFSFGFALPADLRSAPQAVVLTTDGRGKVGPASVTIPVGAPAPPSVAPPVKDKVKLTNQVDKTDISPGTVLTVTGQLTTTTGEPVRSAQIDFLIDGDGVDESTTFTENGGNYTTFVEIPIKEPAGKPTLSIHFGGSDRLEAATKSVVLTVTLDSPEPTTSSAASVAPISNEASAIVDESPAAISDVSTSAPASPVSTPATPPDTNPWAWFMAGLVAVGGTALLVTGILVFRGWGARRNEEDTLHLLGDPDPDEYDDPILPDDGSFLSFDVGEEIEADAPEPPHPSAAVDGTPRPRRGIE